jgi:hypothetical protein
MQCKAKSRSGDPCKVSSQIDSDFCFFHDPKSTEDRKAAQRTGGRARARSVAPIPLGVIDLSDPANIIAVVTLAANQVCSGRLDAKSAHALGHLVDCALKAIPLGAQKQQQDRIERLLEERRNPPVDLREAERMLRFVPVDKDQLVELPPGMEFDAKSSSGNGDHGQDRVGKLP